MANVQNSAIKSFIEKWNGRGREDEDDRSYWIDLLQDVFGLTSVTSRIEFQKKVIGQDGNTKRIDAYIPETNVIIEQKSLHIPLDKPQSGHGGMTPYEQAKMYDNGLPRSEKARWIITSNFNEIWIYNMDTKKPEESVVKLVLENLEKDYKHLSVLYDPTKEQLKRELRVSQEAGDQIGKIYDALLKQYPSEPSEHDLKNLNTFCVRLVFCYYAEDAGLFNDGIFKQYIESFNVQHLRNGLKDLFRVLNTKEDERDPFEESSLLAFPYVNGGLFADSNLIIPQLNEEIKDILVNASDFDWSEISPTIFGAIFESTLNQETRRSGGMHYTSIENIHKVIDPLFLNKFKEEFETIKESKQPNVRVSKLRELQEKMASLKFFDPACGSGNFLTETYLSLRKIENDIISTINIDQIEIADINVNPIKIQLSQFYGIEINDFAVSVAKTALWIAENQMMNKTKAIVYNANALNFLPLKSYTNIVEGNALTSNWNDVLNSSECDYIMGNPPFIGKKEQSKKQKAELVSIFGPKVKGVGNLDYVTAWYKKALDYIKETSIKCAFVSTNSITQGEQVAPFWSQLIKDNIHVDFAYRTFRWDSEANIKAHVHCVIIGFSQCTTSKALLIDENGTVNLVNNINPYLVDAPNVIVNSNSKPLWNVPSMQYGSMPIDDGHLILDSEDVEVLLAENPNNSVFIKEYVGGAELLKNKKRWCLWLEGISPAEIKKSNFVMNRIKLTETFRKGSDRPQTLALAETPALFGEIRQPNTTMLAVPKVSSETRHYIPICYVEPTTIVNGSALIIPNADLYIMGILISNVHMSWMRSVAGRLETRYQYSANVVYNNFPWPSPSEDLIDKIKSSAEKILSARALYPDSSLSDLYDPLIMPEELKKAHKENDKAVMKAYGFKPNTTEAEIVAELMKMYQKKTSNDF